MTFHDHVPLLFINVFPSTLLNPAFLSFITEGLFGSWNSRKLSSMPNKQKLVSLFVQYCQVQTQLVLEGIEEPEDLSVALALGVPIGQGFLLGHPEPLQATQKRR
ncbi:hypothetical protein [Brevibacillus brevis]|uniref:hypothetical protein n=1 Tax=Brevibacillus brevis TaxID=1393 RepID=UPI0021BD3384|nr:hypothetical protein [Brevibacillus brevis]